MKVQNYVVTGLLFVFSLQLVQAKIYPVSNLNEFNKTVSQLLPGDEVVLKNGIWKDVELQFSGKGTAEAPIGLRAETPGKVRIEGKSNLKLSGEYLHISGLIFTNGFTPSNSVIEFRNNREIANNCTVSNCVIDGFTNPEKSKQDFWIQMNGKNNRVEYCYIAGKTNKGMTLTVRLDSLTSIETNHHIYRNYFGKRYPLGENGGETIQIGLSGTSQLNAWTKVEENFFEHCDGEIEIISVKSCENLIINNVFKECQGMLTLRHGHRNTVYGNIFIGNGVGGTGGVRVINENQKVYNNYFSGLRGRGVGSALVLVNGVPNAKPVEYDQVKNAVIFSNTFYDCSTPFQFGWGNGPNRYMRPLNTLLANNLIYCPETDNLIQEYCETDGIRLENNLMINKNGKMKGANMADGDVTIISKGELIVPVSQSLGTIPNDALLDKSKYGPSWWQKSESFATGNQSAKIAQDLLKSEIIRRAEVNLHEKPVTVTAFHSERSAGGMHDFFSEGDYWWADTLNPGGPYVQRDGQTNPDNFVAHRHAMIRFNTCVANLTSAYLLTKDKKYIEAALEHIRAWFIDEGTKMNPNLLYAQAIMGIATGRGIGIIDTIHLIEVVQSLLQMERHGLLSDKDAEGTKQWFSEYLTWLTTHPYGKAEMNAQNNHATCWVMQAAIFAKYTGNKDILQFCTERYKNILLPDQMATDGSFPRELRRTKPYGYSLFNLDAMATVCTILSTEEDNLWLYTTSDGKNMQKGIDFILPFVTDKSLWKYPPDVMYWDEWPVAQPFLFFGSMGLKNQEYLQIWKKLAHFPTNDEVIRNLPIQNPLIWL